MKRVLYRYFPVPVLLLLVNGVFAQDRRVLRELRSDITQLASAAFEGRGYTERGQQRAMKFIERKFSSAGLKPLPLATDSSYRQGFAFPVNTFPDYMYLKVGRKKMIPGADYIIHAKSSTYAASKRRLQIIDFKHAKDSLTWSRIKTDKLQHPSRAYLLKNTDTLYKYQGITRRSLTDSLPKGCYLVGQQSKLIWTVATDTTPSTLFYVADSALPRCKRKITAVVNNKFIREFKSNNVAAFVPGTERPDSFIVFVAHYDHLGIMGKDNIFPGASDNASGTAMLLQLAKYFGAYPQQYSIAFIAFSGEEAGLLGSRHFVNNPLLPLENIRFLVNLDILGDASDGITVVNGTSNPKQLEWLKECNAAKSYFKDIVVKGATSNSDHHYFHERGVPCFFIHSNGGKGYYHDVWDRVGELSLNNIDKVYHLLIDFTRKLQVSAL